MEQYQGKSVFGGVAIGRIHVFSKGQQQVKRIKVQDTEAEKKRYREAVQTAITELQGLYDKALKEVGEANAAIFEMHQMMLEDEDFTESVENIIDSQSVNAEYAVASTGDNFAQMFASMDDEYMRGRAYQTKRINCTTSIPTKLSIAYIIPPPQCSVNLTSKHTCIIFVVLKRPIAIRDITKFLVYDFCKLLSIFIATISCLVIISFICKIP